MSRWIFIDRSLAVVAFRCQRLNQFRPRRSRLDREKIDEERMEFHGFFNLFFSGLVYYALVTLYPYFRTGTLLELRCVKCLQHLG